MMQLVVAVSVSVEVAVESDALNLFFAALRNLPQISLAASS